MKGLWRDLQLGAAALSMAAFGVMIVPPDSPAAPGGPPRRAMLSPVRLSGGEGALVVSDYRARAVFMVNKQGPRALRSFAIDGAPLAVAWFQGLVYVGNETTGSIEVYTPAGKFLSYLGERGQVKSPNDMAIDEESGKVFVVDGRDRSLKVFDRDGGMTQTITSQALVNPTGIVLDAARGEVFVSDYGDPALKYPAQVLVFDYAGNLLRSLPGRTAGFSRPQGMALDDGHVFLADGLIGKVLVLDSSTGAVVKTLGSFGAGPGQLMLPLDVVIDPSTKDVYVTNNRPGRIERFPEGGLLP